MKEMFGRDGVVSKGEVTTYVFETATAVQANFVWRLSVTQDRIGRWRAGRGMGISDKVNIPGCQGDGRRHQALRTHV